MQRRNGVLPAWLLVALCAVSGTADAAVDVATLAPAPSGVTFALSNAFFDRRTGQLSYTGTLANNTAATVHGPVYIVLADFTGTGVQVLSANDVTTRGEPVLIFAADVQPAAPRTFPVVLSSRNKVSFTIRIYVTAPPPNRPPVVDALPNVVLDEGTTLAIPVSATDPDGDAITLEAGALPAFVTFAPTGAGTGAFTAAPGFGDAGDYPITLTARDARDASASGSFTISVTDVNRAPAGDAGLDRVVRTGETVQLVGTASDPDGDTVAFNWRFTSRPAGSQAELAGGATALASFAPDRVGAYVVELALADGRGGTATDTVTITAELANSPPLAAAGADRVVAVGTTVTVDGSASSDPDGDPLSFAWTLAERPAGSLAALSGSGATASFTADVVGDYTLLLSVTDDDGFAATDDVVVRAEGANQPPTAEAGADQSLGAGNTATLDGRGSTDPDGDPLEFEWLLLQRPNGSAATLSAADTATPTLLTDLPGTYVVGLGVTDDSGASNDDIVLVVATADNRAPRANAGPDQQITRGATVQLNGSASSDVDQDALAFAWTLLSAPAGSAGALAGADTMAPSFVADVGGLYVARLIVNDGTVDSPPDTVEILAAVPPNAAPTITSAPVTGAAADTAYAYDVEAIDAETPTSLTFDLTAAPAGMAIDTSTGVVSWLPTGAQTGPNAVVVRVRDADGLTATQAFSIDVGAAQTPVANDDSYTTRVGEVLAVAAPGVLANDVSGSGAPLAARLTQSPANGTLALAADGGFTYRDTYSPGSVISLDDGNITQLLPGIVATSGSPAAAPIANVIDGQFWTYWVTNAFPNPANVELTFPQDITVNEIRLWGIRFTTQQALSRPQSGTVIVLDAAGQELVQSPVALSGPYGDGVVSLGGLSGVRRIRFVANTTNQLFENRGLAEIEVRGPITFTRGPGLQVYEKSANLYLRQRVGVTPMIANLTDDNGDGDIDTDDVPDMAFVRMTGEQLNGGPLVVLSGDDGREHFRTPLPFELAAYGDVAIGDIDDDGLPEIIATNQAGNALHAFEHDGTPKWTSTIDALPGRGDHGGTIAIANLDGAGRPEIVIGASVYDADGVLRGDGRDLGGTYGFVALTAKSAVADIDLDGVPEIVAGPTAYRYTNGQLVRAWQRPGLLDGWTSIGNFDDDGFAEIVIVGRPNVGTAAPMQVLMLNHDGSVAEVWNPPTGAPLDLPDAFAGQALIADLDGDGVNEIGVAGMSRYWAFERDGTILWQAPIVDNSGVTGSTAFDFDGDGSVEVVYRDEQYLHIFRGSDGAVLFQRPLPGGTGNEQPVVADVDNDGHAEIVVTSEFDSSLGNDAGAYAGVHVFEDIADLWVPTRRIWNQHAYSVTNVREDATIPLVERPNWLTPGLNNFKQNAIPPDEERADRFTYRATDGTLESNEATVRLLVRPPNTAPDITSNPPRFVTEGLSFAYAVDATDPDPGDVLAYSLPDAPAGMTIDAALGVVRWDVALGGAHDVTVRVEDSQGFFDVQSFTLTVSPPTTVPNITGLLESCPLFGPGGPAFFGPTPYVSFDQSPFRNLSLDYFHLETTEDGAVNVPGVTLEPIAGISSVRIGPGFNDSVDADDGAIDGSGLAGQAVANFITGSPTDITFTFDAAALGGLPNYAGLVWTDASPGATIMFEAFGPTGASLGVVGPFTGLQDGSFTGQTGEDRFFGIVHVGGISRIRVSASFNLIEADHLQYGRCNSVATLLSDAGLSVGQISQASHATVAAGRVSQQQPAAGAIVARGSNVGIVISTGPGPADIDDDGDGFSETQGDCNDTNAGIGPGAIDVPGNGIDEDCSGGDAPVPPSPLTIDDDGDGLSEIQGDCNDANPAIGPGAADIPNNGIDEDCNGADAVEGDQSAPSAVILTPLEDGEFTLPTPITGTADDPNFLRYELSLAAVDSNDFTVIGSGTSPVVGGALGELDPTLLENGIYRLRLTAEDANGQVAMDERPLRVTGLVKPGVFRISFVDLEISVGGIPIKVVRTYDSRVNSSEDFGFGWTLDIQRALFQHNRRPGDGWQIQRTGGPFGLPCRRVVETRGHLSEVRFSDSEVYTFALELVQPAAVVGGCVAEARYFQISGTRPGATLDILDGTTVFFASGGDEVVDFDTGNAYEPQRALLTLPDGTEVTLDRSAGGVTRIETLNGDALWFGDDSIVHSSGQSIALARDAAGRISRITDPRGGSLQYTYDGAGDLVGVLDRDSSETSFRYDPAHRLLDIDRPDRRGPVEMHYDADGRLIALVNADGVRREFDHDIIGRTEVITDAAGNETIYSYNEGGDITREENALGHVTTHVYDENGNELSRTDALGNVTTWTFDANSNMTSQVDAAGNHQTWTYGAFNRLTSHTDARGNTTTYQYDNKGNLTQVVDRMGFVTTHSYDARGLRISTADCRLLTTTYGYDLRGRRTLETDSLGHSANYGYDTDGNRTSEMRFRTGPTGPEPVSLLRLFDANGAPLWEVDGEGYSELRSYASNGLPSRVTDRNGNLVTRRYTDTGSLFEAEIHEDGSEIRNQFDVLGNLLATTDRDGNAQRMAYDAIGRVTRLVSETGATTLLAYDAGGRITQVTHDDGTTVSLTWDAFGRITELADPLGGHTIRAYDANGNLVSETDANGNTTQHFYDANDRRIRTRYADGSEISLAYLAGCEDELASVTDENGLVTRFEYDALRQLTAVVDATGGRTEYGYDEVGNRTSMRDSSGRVTTYAYDRAGRRTETTYSDGAFEDLAADGNGNVTARQSSQGASSGLPPSALAYDGDDQLTRRESRLAGMAPIVHTFEYSPAGKRTRAGGDTYAYDARGRLIRETKQNGQVLTYTYDSLDRRASLTTSAGTVQYGYDTANRVTSLTAAAATTTFGYDAAGNRISVARPNGTTTRYAYDERNRVIRVQHFDGTGALASSFDYTLGAAGERLRVVESGPATRGRTIDYGYDNVYRLIEERIDDAGTSDDRVIAYEYDARGTRTRRIATVGPRVATTTYNSNARGAVTSWNSLMTTANPGGTPTSPNFWYVGEAEIAAPGSAVLPNTGASVPYELDGQLLGINGGGALNAWTTDGRLVTAHTVPGPNQALNMQLEYDADGLRTRVTHNGVVTDYVYDKAAGFGQLVLVRTSTGESTSYIWADELLSQTDSRSGLSYFHADAHQSIRHLSDATGATTDIYGYDAFGIEIDSTGTTPNLFRYAGEQRDDLLSGNYYLRARYYSPAMGQFISPDPHPGDVLDPRTLHKYAYANASPMNFRDPSGLSSLPELSSVASIAGTLAALSGAQYFVGGTAALLLGSRERTKWSGELASVSIGPVQWIDYYMDSDCGMTRNGLGIQRVGGSAVFGGWQAPIPDPFSAFSITGGEKGVSGGLGPAGFSISEGNFTTVQGIGRRALAFDGIAIQASAEATAGIQLASLSYMQLGFSYSTGGSLFSPDTLGYAASAGAWVGVSGAWEYSQPTACALTQ
jgi:RHS repeat-associated protein